jgi:catabolite regulation protein CreA
MKIIYKKNIICNYDERLQTIILTVSIYREKLYGGHTKNSITLIPSKSTNYLVSRLKQFEDGLTIGFTKRIYQAGV